MCFLDIFDNFLFVGVHICQCQCLCVCICPSVSVLDSVWESANTRLFERPGFLLLWHLCLCVGLIVCICVFVLDSVLDSVWERVRQDCLNAPGSLCARSLVRRSANQWACHTRHVLNRGLTNQNSTKEIRY